MGTDHDGISNDSTQAGKKGKSFVAMHNFTHLMKEEFTDFHHEFEVGMFHLQHSLQLLLFLLAERPLILHKVSCDFEPWKIKHPF